MSKNKNHTQKLTNEIIQIQSAYIWDHGKELTIQS